MKVFFQLRLFRKHRILAEAAIKAKVDFLEGLKEAVIVGHPVPAGTGLKEYRKNWHKSYI